MSTRSPVFWRGKAQFSFDARRRVSLKIVLTDDSYSEGQSQRVISERTDSSSVPCIF